jgi:hypothetical protein
VCGNPVPIHLQDNVLSPLQAKACQQEVRVLDPNDFWRKLPVFNFQSLLDFRILEKGLWHYN